MLKKLAEILLDSMQKNITLQYEVEIYQFGLEGLLSYLLGLSIQMVFCLYSGYWLETLLFIVFFESMRVFVGGYHATTYLRCNITYLGVYVIFCWVIQLKVAIFLYVSFLIIAILVIVVKAPVEHEHRPVNQQARKASQKASRSLLIVFIMASFGLSFQYPLFSKIIGYTIILNAAMMVIALYVKLRKKAR